MTDVTTSVIPRTDLPWPTPSGWHQHSRIGPATLLVHVEELRLTERGELTRRTWVELRGVPTRMQNGPEGPLDAT